MPQPNIAQAILRVAQAIAQGRYEAKDVAGMSEDQVDQLNEHLMAELNEGIASDEAAIAEAESQSETVPEN